MKKGRERLKLAKENTAVVKLYPQESSTTNKKENKEIKWCIIKT